MTHDLELMDGYPGKDTARVRPVLSDVICRAEECELELSIGIFTDGTGNNWEWVENDHTQNQLQRQKDSNVYRLHLAYPDDGARGYYRIYAPGVGTPFDDIGEYEATSLGKGFGAGGDGRINFALLEVLNAIYRALTGDKSNKRWLSPASIKALCRNGRRKQLAEGLSVRWPEGDAPVLQRLGRAELGGLLRDPDDEPRRTFLRQQCERLGKLIANTRKPKIKRIVFDVFGFSRGAAEARVFCNWLGELMGDGKLCGVPAEIRFLGLFDTVASVGGSALLGSDGHGDWASAENLRIGPHVKRCVHFVAMHEQRASFPLDTVRNPDGSVPKNCQQWMFPGMHSDVGGGYTPQEQGRGPGQLNSQKLSQIPLNRMYEAARQAGVPLDKSLAVTISASGKYDPFEIDPELQKAFDAFMAVHAGPPRRLREWLKPYLIWRYQQRYNYVHLPWSERCPEDDKAKLVQANKNFIEDLRAFEPQRTLPDWFDPTDPKNAGRHQDIRMSQGAASAGNEVPPGEASEIFNFMRESGPVPAALGTLFADYVHDSHAGFSPVKGWHEPTGYLHYRRQYMGSDKALTQLDTDDRQYA